MMFFCGSFMLRAAACAVRTAAASAAAASAGRLAVFPCFNHGEYDCGDHRQDNRANKDRRQIILKP